MEKRVFSDSFNTLVDQYVGSATPGAYSLNGFGLEIPPTEWKVNLAARLPDTFDAGWRQWIKVDEQPVNSYGVVYLGVIPDGGSRGVAGAVAWKGTGAHGYFEDADFGFTDLGHPPGLDPVLGEAVIAAMDDRHYKDGEPIYIVEDPGDPGHVHTLEAFEYGLINFADWGPWSEDKAQYLAASPAAPFWVQLRAPNDSQFFAEVWDTEPTSDGSASPVQSVLLELAVPLGPVNFLRSWAKAGWEGNPPQYPPSGKLVLRDWVFATGVESLPVTTIPGDIQAQKAHGGIVRDHSTVGGGKTPGAQIKEL